VREIATPTSPPKVSFFWMKPWYGSTDFISVPQSSCYESVSIVFFVIFNTSSTLLGYHLADLCDLEQQGKLLTVL
jgi:hypothetical protein